MDKIGQVHLKTLELMGLGIKYDPAMLHMTWVVMAFLIIMGLIVSRKLTMIPSKIQSAAELIYLFLKDITESTLGEEEGKKFIPLVVTIFLFILASNWIGLIPNFTYFIGTLIALVHNLIDPAAVTIKGTGIMSYVLEPSSSAWYYFLFKVPAIEEPTKFLSTCLSLAILVFFIVHYNAIKSKGIINYFKGYMEPLPEEAPYIYFFWLNPFFYLNIVGEIAKVVSHSFRLYGNIFGGSIIIIIVSSLLKFILIPVGLFAFFVLFAGLIQAFVFTMLAVTYIAVAK